MSDIRWMPVVGYEDYYEVSETGLVRRVRAGRGASAGKLLRQAKGDGYHYVQLCRRDVKRKVGVHILVCEAFHGRRPRGKVPNHKNFIKNDNRVDNLEWLTAKQNAKHAVAGGRPGGKAMPGELNGRAKLSAAQASAVRRLKGIVGQRDLALLCGVSKTLIQKIHQGKLWPEDLRVRELPEARG